MIIISWCLGRQPQSSSSHVLFFVKDTCTFTILHILLKHPRDAIFVENLAVGLAGLLMHSIIGTFVVPSAPPSPARLRFDFPQKTNCGFLVHKYNPGPCPPHATALLAVRARANPLPPPGWLDGSQADYLCFLPPPWLEPHRAVAGFRLQSDAVDGSGFSFPPFKPHRSRNIDLK